MKLSLHLLTTVLGISSVLCAESSGSSSSEHSHHHKHHVDKYAIPSYGLNLKNWRKSGPTDINPDNVDKLGNPAFTINTTGAIYSNPAIVDGVAYFSDANGVVYAVNAETGATIWSSPALVGTAYLTPAVGKDLLYFEVDNRFNPPSPNYVTAIRKSNGSIAWQRSVDDNTQAFAYGFSAPVLIEDEDIVIFCHDYGQDFASVSFAKISAFKASTGTPLWTYQTSQVGTGQPNSGTGGAGIFGTPAVNTKTGLMYIGTGQNYYNGSPPLPNTFVITPVSDSLIALNYRTGQYVWHHQFTPDDVNFGGVDIKNWDADATLLLSTCIKGEKKEVAVVGTKEGVVYCLDQLTGELYWQTHLNGPGPCGYLLDPNDPNSLVPGSATTGVNTSGCTDGEYVYFGSFYAASGIPNQGGTSPADQSLPVTEFFALRACNGSIKWRTERYRGCSLGPVTYSDGIVWAPIVRGTYSYNESPIVSRGAMLRALDSANGKSLFEFAMAPSSANESALRSYAGVSVYKNNVYFPFGAFSPGGINVFELPESAISSK